MITEDYVSFETAKLLKEKGFNEYCMYFYRNPYEGYLGRKDGFEFNQNSDHKDEEWYACPTHQMAMKWLREEYNLHIQIWILEEKGYWFDIEKILNSQYKHKSLYSTGLEDIYFKSNEEVTEVAIKYCLENLI